MLVVIRTLEAWPRLSALVGAPLQCFGLVALVKAARLINSVRRLISDLHLL